MRFLKKHLKLIVLILTCILVYVIYNNNNNHDISYISLGDGFSMGINSYGVKDYGYNDYLKDYLKKNKKLHQYYNNFSYQDIRIKDLYKDILINRKNNKNENIRQSLRNSNLLTITIGLNDIIYQSNLPNKNQTTIMSNINKDLNLLIQEIEKYYKYDIYIIGYYNVFPQNSVESKYLTNLNKIFEQLSKNANIKYINIEQIFSKNKEYLENPNSFYPNSTGYKLIYKKIINTITLTN